jgi:hypothetical protein
VITGDLINKGGDAAQAAELQRISAKLDPEIRLFSIIAEYSAKPSKSHWSR